MTTEVFGSQIPLPLVLVAPALGVLLGAMGWIAGRIVLFVLSRGARKTPTDLDDVLIRAVRGPLTIASALAGIWFALRALPLSHELDLYLNRGWIFAATFLLVSVGLRAINGLTKEVLVKSESLGGAAGIVRVVGRLIVVSLGGVMLLQSLGIHVEPLIASLGIGSLAVGFALKDTLSNLFAGVYLFADRPIRVGDYVKLEGGEEGFVVTIGWRATRIRMLANNMIIVPNSKLSESILTNYHLPEPQMSVVIDAPVSYGADPVRVMEILVEEAKAAAPEIPGMLAEPEPFARFITGFGDSAMNFSLVVRVETFVDQFLVQSEIRRRILARFAGEGIAVPYPQRTIHAPGLEKLVAEKLAGGGPSTGAAPDDGPPPATPGIQAP